MEEKKLLLHSNFLNELFKACLRSQTILELSIPHIKYTYLPDEHYKSCWQQIVKYYQGSEKLISIGLLSQQFENNPKVISIIKDIKDASEPDENILIDQLEIYIKDKITQELATDIEKLFNSGKKDELPKLLQTKGLELENFKIKDVGNYKRIIKDFHYDHYNRLNKLSGVERLVKRKIPLGIPAIDQDMHGGVDRGDTVLVVAPYGVGKSKFLKWCGLTAMKLGNFVIHVQAEGSEEEAQTAYQAGIAGKSMNDMENANITDKEMIEIDKFLNQVTFEEGEIFLKSFSQFNTGTMKDIHNYCQEIFDRFGRVDMIIIDYIDKVDPGDGVKYPGDAEGQRRKRIASAEKLKNICLQFDAVGITATQAKNLSVEKRNDPKFIITGDDISEVKGLPQPFSYCFSLNRTEDEVKDNIIRIGKFKSRKYKKSKSYYTIVENYDRERFYYNTGTIQRFGQI